MGEGKSWPLGLEQKQSGPPGLWRPGSEMGPDVRWELEQEQGPELGLGRRRQQERKRVWKLEMGWTWSLC